jgi:poly(A) polymerase/tRNA nucleotidyltransferase (CCA-adding enzyme)
VMAVRIRLGAFMKESFQEKNMRDENAKEKKEQYEIPKEILASLKTLQKANFDAYLVGGCVRDLVLSEVKGLLIKPKDWDITTNATPEQIQKIFSETFYENQFGTVGVVTRSENPILKVIEITPYRLETKYSDKRHPDEVKWAETLEEDLERRDFTINAMALKCDTNIRMRANDTNRYELVDLFGGQDDLKNKLIRAVGNPEERFDEDALRILRAIRFSAELDFDIEEKTEKALEKKKELLEMISKERIRDELVKMLMSEHPDKGFEKMRETGILRYVLPELEEGYGITQNKEHIYTVWEHNIRSMMHAARKNWPLEIRLASLLHDIGKPRTKEGEGPDSTFYGHEIVSAKMTARILERLRFPKKFSEKVLKLVRWHLFFSDVEKITLSAVRRIIRNVGPENIWDLMKIRFTDRVGMGRPKEEPFRLRKYEAMIEQCLRDPISVSMLKIDGNKVMEIAEILPSPKVGYILHALLEQVLDDPSLNTPEWLSENTKRLAMLPDEELKKFGEAGKGKKAELEEKEIEKIKEKYRIK